MADVAVAPEPSTGDSVETGLPELSQMSAEERQDWLVKGTPTTPIKKEATADSPPANPSAAAEKPAETAADPESAPPQEHKANKGAEARIKQLLAENKELREKAAKPPAEPAKTAEAAKVEPKNGRPVRPIFGDKDGETWSEFTVREDAYHEDLASFKAKELLESERSAEAKNRAVTESKKRWDGAIKEYGDGFPELVKTVVDATPEGLQMAISDLDDWPAVAVHLANHPDKLAEIVELFELSEVKAIARLGRIEAALSAKPASEVPATKAPRPATPIAGHKGAPPDPLRAAIEADDFPTYQRLQNEREIAARKRA